MKGNHIILNKLSFKFISLIFTVHCFPKDLHIFYLRLDRLRVWIIAEVFSKVPPLRMIFLCKTFGSNILQKISYSSSKIYAFAGCNLMLEKDDKYPLVRVYQEVESENKDGSVQLEWMEITDLQWIEIGW